MQDGFKTYIIYHIRNELDINEFRCPQLDEENWQSKTTIKECESMVMNQGCSRIKRCLAYKEQKDYQDKHPEIEWEKIWLNSEDKIKEIKLIKKGLLVMPK